MTDSPETAPPPVGETVPLAINPSKWQAIAIALALACVTAYGVASNLLIYASTRDIAGLIVYLRGSDFLQGISAIALIGGTGGIVVRALRRKLRELYLETKVDSRFAYLKGGPDDPALLPPTRARETATRLVDRSVLHRGLALADGVPLAALRPNTAGGTPSLPVKSIQNAERRVVFAAPTTPAVQHMDDFTTGRPVEGAVDVPVITDAMLPSVKALDEAVGLRPASGAAPAISDPLNTAAFDAEWKEWFGSGDPVSFSDHLIARGWTYVDRRWREPAAKEG